MIYVPARIFALHTQLTKPDTRHVRWGCAHLVGRSITLTNGNTLWRVSWTDGRAHEGEGAVTLTKKGMQALARLKAPLLLDPQNRSVHTVDGTAILDLPCADEGWIPSLCVDATSDLDSPTPYTKPVSHLLQGIDPQRWIRLLTLFRQLVPKQGVVASVTAFGTKLRAADHSTDATAYITHFGNHEINSFYASLLRTKA